MTSDQKATFSRLLITLGTIHNRKMDPAVLEVYFDALKDIPFELLASGAEELKKHARHMPKPADWREAAQKVRRASVPQAPPLVDDNGLAIPNFICLRCEDTGWRPACGCDMGRLEMNHRCPQHGGEGAPEGKAPIRVRACECRPRNPEFHRDRGARYVETDHRGAA